MNKLEQYYLFLLRYGNQKVTAKQDYESIVRLSKKTTLDHDALEKYLFDKYLDGANTNGLNKIVSSIRKYGKFTQDKTLEEFKYFKKTKTNKSILSDAEIEQIINLPKSHNSRPEAYYQWTLWLKLLSFSGARAGEISTLTVDQCDFGRQVFILDKTKTTPRLVPMAPILIDELKAYIGTLKRQEQLFIINGQIPNKSMWDAHFKTRLKRCNIKRPHLSIHSLRHSFITRLLETEGVNLFTLQLSVGHKDASTTQKYFHASVKGMTKMIAKDPLGRQNLSYEERFVMFREEVRKLLSQFSLTLEEEKKMLHDIH